MPITERIIPDFTPNSDITKAVTASALNAIVDQTNDITRTYANEVHPDFRVPDPTSDIFLASITDAGPNGEGNTKDSPTGLPPMYWVQRLTIRQDVGDGTPLATAAQSIPVLPNIVLASNLGETSKKTLAKGKKVIVHLLQTANNGAATGASSPVNPTSLGSAISGPQTSYYFIDQELEFYVKIVCHGPNGEPSRTDNLYWGKPQLVDDSATPATYSDDPDRSIILFENLDERNARSHRAQQNTMAQVIEIFADYYTAERVDLTPTAAGPCTTTDKCLFAWTNTYSCSGTPGWGGATHAAGYPKCGGTYSGSLNVWQNTNDPCVRIMYSLGAPEDPPIACTVDGDCSFPSTGPWSVDPDDIPSCCEPPPPVTDTCSCVTTYSILPDCSMPDGWGAMPTTALLLQCTPSLPDPSQREKWVADTGQLSPNNPIVPCRYFYQIVGDLCDSGGCSIGNCSSPSAPPTDRSKLPPNPCVGGVACGPPNSCPTCFVVTIEGVKYTLNQTSAQHYSDSTNVVTISFSSGQWQINDATSRWEAFGTCPPLSADGTAWGRTAGSETLNSVAACSSVPCNGINGTQTVIIAFDPDTCVVTTKVNHYNCGVVTETTDS